MRAYIRKYNYDRLGNVQQLKQLGTNGFTRNFVYHTGKNTLQKIETAAPALIEDFTYDTCGNQLTAGTTRNYVWNAANQLITYKNQSGSNDPTIFAQYDYSGMNRVSKMVKTGSAGSPVYERTIYIDGVFEYHILENGTTYEKNYVHVMDASTGSAPSRIAMIRIGDQFPDDIADSVTYNLEDQIGSSSMRLNTSGGVIDKEEYYPFGDSSLRTFSKKRYRYVGKEKDLESGLYYYGARYYSAWTCRFISVDPLASDYPFYTPYQNAGNKPINASDLDGLEEDPKMETGGQGGETGQQAQEGYLITLMMGLRQWQGGETGQQAQEEDKSKPKKGEQGGDSTSPGEDESKTAEFKEGSLVSFMVMGEKVAGNKKDGAMQGNQDFAKRSDWVLIYADEAEDAYNKIKEFKEKNKILVNNIMFESHGGNKVAAIQMGDRQYYYSASDNMSGSNLKTGKGNPKKYLSMYSGLEIQGSIIIGSCFVGGTHNGGQQMLSLMSQWMGVNVIGNQSWDYRTESKNGKKFGIPTGEDQWWRKVKNYTDALANVGKFTVASPDGTIKTEYGLYTMNNGGFGFSGYSNIKSTLEAQKLKIPHLETKYGWNQPKPKK